MNRILNICTFKAELRKAVSLLLIVAILAGLIPQSVYATQAVGDTVANVKTYEGDGYEVRAEITASWGAYANVDFKIINKSLHKMSGWQLKIPKTFTWSNLWNAKSAEDEGSYYVLEGADYNQDIGLFGQVSFGGTMFFSSGKVTLPESCAVTDEKMRAESDASDDTGAGGKEDEPADGEIESSRLPYEIPKQLEGLNYALFCAAESGTQIYANETKINGDVYSDGDFFYQGTALSVTGTINAAKSIQVTTSSMDGACQIGGRKENADKIVMPDLCNVLKEHVFTNEEEIKETIEINGDSFYGDGILYAKQDIIYNVGNASTTEDKSLLLCAENGNITLNGSTFEINGVLYAPNGCVSIHANQATINGRIIAKRVCLNGTYINICAGAHDFDKIREWIDESGEQEMLEAELAASGNLKENRRVVLDVKSTSEVAFDNTLTTEWKFTKADGEDITETVCIDADMSTDTHKELLFKKAGNYIVTVEIKQGEKQLKIEKELVIEKDLAPEAGFVYTQDFFVRDETGVAAIVADDVSLSHDGDEIAHRTWQIIYDADNDGVFDETPQTVSDGNDTQLIYTTKKVGAYKVILTVKEHFDDTIKEYVTEKDYLRDDTADAPESSCIIRVLNEAPEVSFAMEKAAKADIVFTTSDSEKEKIDYVNEKILEMKESLVKDGVDVNIVSVNSATLTAKDNFAWKEYDHYDYKEEYGEKEVVPKHITYHDESILITGYTKVPYKDFLFVADESNNTKILQFDLERDKNNWHTIEGGGFLFNTEIDEENDIINGFCVLLCESGVKVMELKNVPLSKFRDGSGEYGTCIATVKMTDVLEKKQFRMQADAKKLTVWCNDEVILSDFVLPQATSYGYGPILWNASHACDQISYFDFTNIKMTTVEGEDLGSVLSSHPWREGAKRYVVQLSDMEILELTASASLAQTAKALMEKEIFLFVIGNEKAAPGATKLLLQTDSGMFLSRDEIEESMQTVGGYITGDMKQEARRIGDYISVSDLLSYKENYADKENDTMHKSEWTYTLVPLLSQDETLSDASAAVYEQPLERLLQTGAYTISLRAQDNPGSISENTVSGNDLAQDNPFGRWSEPYVYPQTIVVQTLPVANLTVCALKDTRDSKRCAFSVSTESYDPDHMGEEGKGIIAEKVWYKEIGDAVWTEGIPQYSVPMGGVYLFKYQVQDKEKSYSYPSIAVVDTSELLEFEPYVDETKPELSFSVSPAKISLGESISISAFAKDENPLSYFRVYCEGNLQWEEQGVYSYVPQKKGSRAIRVTARDIAGNSISKTITVKVVEDDINAPQIKIDSMTVSPDEPGKLTVSGNVCDDTALKEYTVSYRGDAADDYTQVFTSSQEVENGVVAQIDIKDFEDGKYELLIRAEDESGNTSFYSGYFTLTTQTLGGQKRIWIDEIVLNREKSQIEVYGSILQKDETETVSGNCIRLEDESSVSMNSISCEDGLIGVIPTENMATGHYEVTFVVAAQDGTFTKETAEFTYTAGSTDDEQSDDVIVIPDEKPSEDGKATLALELSRAEAEIGSSVTVRVKATGSISENSICAYHDGEEISLTNGKGTFTSHEPKEVCVTATALTKDGKKLNVTQSCYFINKTDKTAPVVSFKGADEEGNLCIVAKKPVDFIGTVKDDEKLLSWKLTYRMQEWEEEVVLTQGDKEKKEELLATLDTTLLANGVYEIKLTATDEGGNESSATCTCTVEGNLKIGEMSIAFKDLVTKMPFGDLSVLRMYDSRNKTVGDFGYGWSLGLSGMTVRQTKPIEKGYEQTRSGSGLSTVYQLKETYAHDVVISYGDGTSDRFRVNLSPKSQRWFAIDEVSVNFVCETNPNLKLELADDNSALVNGDELEWVFGNSGRSSYILTMEDKTKVYISEKDGVTKTVDAVGNTMTYAEEGFLYEDGRGVRFERDFEGRITKISDEAGHVRTYAYDADGNLSTYTDGAGNTVTYTYDDEHRLVQIIDPSGIAVARYEYDESGRLVATIDAEGNRIEYNHDLENRKEIVTDRRGFESVYVYDENGNILSVTDPEGNTTRNTYDENGNVLTETDALGNTKTYVYDENNNITQVTDAAGNISNTYYDSQNRVTSMKNMDGIELLLDYNDKGLLTATEDTAGNVTEYAYDAYGNISGITDDLGAVATYTYDENGNLIKSVDGEGNETKHTYDAYGNRTKTVQYKTTASGSKAAVTTTYVYDDAGHVIKSTSPSGTTTTTYDASGNITQTKDGQGRVTTYTHTPTGEMDTITYYDGTTESFTYDEEGNVLTQTDRLGNTVRNTYDKAGNLKTSVDALGNTTTYVYDAAYRVTKVITPTGATTTYEYDSLGRNTKITTDEGSVLYEYDAYGNILSMTDACGNVTKYEYNDLGHKTAVILPDGSKQTTTYDARGNVLSQTDAEGAKTTYTYDNNNNLTSVTNGEGEKTTYVYNGAGELLSQTDANGNTTTYRYNGAGNVTEEIRADGKSKSYSYNTAGDVTGVTDYDATKLSHSYKNSLLMQSRVGTNVVKYTYDDYQRLTSAYDSTGTIRYGYDSYGRIASRETATGEKIEYGYDAFGRMNAVTTSQGTTRYGFDKYDRLISVTDHAGNKTTYTYDSVGNKASQTNPDGSETTYTYDACNRLTKEVTRDKGGNLLATYEYAFNGNGQKVETRESVKSDAQGMVATITTYGYDKANRLIKEESHVAGEDGTKDTSIVKYSYDSAGNRTKKVEDGVETEYTYNELNQLLSEMTEGKETISYAYDTNGNLLCRGTTTEYETYTYTKANMLESVTSTTKTGETKETYEYDAEGNRLSKTESKEVKEVDESTGEVTTAWEEIDETYYVMDTSGSYSQVIAELDKDKEVKVLYNRGDGIISREEKSETGESSYNFYLSDGHGDVRQLTDEAGKVTDSYRYNSYGELKETQGETDNPYLYTGEYYDEGTGLYYLRARYMNPETGIFTSMDTYRGNSYDPASLHRYTYAQNNPQMYNDPSGHSAVGLFLRQRHNAMLMGALCGMVARIINDLLGRPIDPAFAYATGAVIGLSVAGMAGAYIGMTVIQVLAMLGTVMQVHFTAESAAELVCILAFGVTGNNPRLLRDTSWAVFAVIVNCVALGVCLKLSIAGPRGNVSVGIKYKATYGQSSGNIPKPDTTRINLANGRTRFTPLRQSGNPVSAGMNHITEQHFNRPLGENRSIFSISVDYLKEILQRKTTITATITDAGNGTYHRVVDVGEIIGNVSLKYGGDSTTWMKIITDIKGNIITAFPVPKP